LPNSEALVPSNGDKVGHLLILLRSVYILLIVDAYKLRYFLVNLTLIVVAK
jgi:hypothetical protein